MKRKLGHLALIFIAFIQMSCTKDPTEKETSFSILGDSYSTFEGFVTPESNDVWYNLPPDNYINVTNVSQMWWWQVQKAMNWELDHNNSFSGSVLCNWDTTIIMGHILLFVVPMIWGIPMSSLFLAAPTMFGKKRHSAISNIMIGRMKTFVFSVPDWLFYARNSSGATPQQRFTLWLTCNSVRK